MITGGCACGSVRYEVSQPFVSSNYCHCTRCQRRSGTAASANGRCADGTFHIVAGEELVKCWDPGGGFDARKGAMLRALRHARAGFAARNPSAVTRPDVQRRCAVELCPLPSW